MLSFLKNLLLFESLKNSLNKTIQVNLCGKRLKWLISHDRTIIVAPLLPLERPQEVTADSVVVHGSLRPEGQSEFRVRHTPCSTQWEMCFVVKRSASNTKPTPMAFLLVEVV